MSNSSSHRVAAFFLVSVLLAVASIAHSQSAKPPRPLPKGWDWKVITIGRNTGKGVKDTNWPNCGRHGLNGDVTGEPLYSEVICEDFFIPQKECGVKVFYKGGDDSFTHGRSAQDEPGTRPTFGGFVRTRVPNDGGKPGFKGCNLHFRNWGTTSSTYLLAWPSPTQKSDPWKD